MILLKGFFFSLVGESNLVNRKNVRFSAGHTDGRCMALAAINRAISRYRNDADSVCKYARAGLILANKLRNVNDIGFMHLRLAVGLMNLDDNVKALKELVFAESHISGMDPEQIKGAIYRARGLCQYKLAEYEDAVKSLITAVDIYKSQGKWLEVPMCYSIISSVFKENKNVEKCLAYNLKALALAAELLKRPRWNYTSDELYSLLSNYVDFNGNLGNFYNDLGVNYRSKALAYYNLAIENSCEKVNVGAHALFLANDSGLYYKLNDRKGAEQMSMKSLQLSREFKLGVQEVNALCYLGNFASTPIKSMRYFQQAIFLCRRTGNKNQLKVILKNRAKRAEEFGYYKLALYSYREYKHINDRLVNFDQTIKIANLEANAILRESQIMVKGLELDNLRQTTTNRMYLFMGILAVFLAAIFITFNVRLRTVNNALKIKTKELEELSSFKSRVFFILEHDVSSALSGISGILYLLSNNRSIIDYDQLLNRLVVFKDSALEMLNNLCMWGAVGNPIINAEHHFMISSAIMSVLKSSQKIAEGKNISIALNSNEEFGVVGNIRHFEFILRNFLGNAIKFSPPAETISLCIKRDGSQVVVSVRNRGEFIQNYDINQVFSGNFVSTPGTNGETGAGLGLMLCGKIAEIDGYTLGVERISGYIQFSISIPTHI